MATETGCKDHYFQHFVNMIQDAVNKLRTEQQGRPAEPGKSKSQEIREMLASLRAQLPEDIFNPMLDIPRTLHMSTEKLCLLIAALDFDPNQDSPVEILHVVLLGVVKYWWRDAVSRQNESGKDELCARLESLDVSGLDCAKLRGKTLVQYAGSLIGRDFRVILQVAPVVLQGLISEVQYEAWLALTRLAPLVFQPKIANLSEYVVGVLTPFTSQD